MWPAGLLQSTQYRRGAPAAAVCRKVHSDLFAENTLLCCLFYGRVMIIMGPPACNTQVAGLRTGQDTSRQMLSARNKLLGGKREPSKRFHVVTIKKKRGGGAGKEAR